VWRRLYQLLKLQGFIERVISRLFYSRVRWREERLGLLLAWALRLLLYQLWHSSWKVWFCNHIILLIPPAFTKIDNRGSLVWIWLHKIILLLPRSFYSLIIEPNIVSWLILGFFFNSKIILNVLLLGIVLQLQDISLPFRSIVRIVVDVHAVYVTVRPCFILFTVRLQSLFNLLSEMRLVYLGRCIYIRRLYNCCLLDVNIWSARSEVSIHRKGRFRSLAD
jgi:hypothetical protein